MVAFSRRIFVLSAVAALQFLAPASSSAEDEVLYWNAVAVRTMQVAPAVPGPLQSRFLAIVHISIFDAVNGIERRFTPIHVCAVEPCGTGQLATQPAPGASKRAAAVYAAYTALVRLRPDQTAQLNEARDASLAGIGPDAALENSESIERGRDWGVTVAAEILAWCATDGLVTSPSTYVGNMGVGQWRPTPPANLPGLVPSLGSSRPFVIPSVSMFHPAGAPALTSQEYADDVNEVKLVGELGAPLTARTADQTQSARFWGGAAASVWNRAAVNAARQRNTTLSQNARLLALVNMAGADALIVAWESKYFHNLWRPITAIRLASTDGNPDTVEQADWTPLLATPPYPEYYSGHQSVSGTAQAVLTAFFGDDVPMEAYSEVFGTGVTRSWPNFATAADEAFMARIWAGIHYRFAMRTTRAVAEQVAAYVMEHAARPLHGERVGQLSQ